MKRFLIALTMAAVLALPAQAAFAQTVQPASGTFTVVSESVTSVRQVGTDCVINLAVVFSFQGTLVGSFNPPANFVLVQQAPCNQSGPITFVAAGTFEGTVNGAAGTFNFVFVGSLPDPQHAQGTLYILGGTGQLSQLSGTLVLTGTPHVGGTYAGTVAFGSD
jgi:hypothetical protein